MKKFSIVVLITFLVCSFLIMLLRFAELPNTTKNGFNRTWITTKSKIKRETDINIPLQKICGATKNHLFFSVPNPQGIIMFDTLLKKQDTILYGLPFNKNLLGPTNILIDSPSINFLAYNISTLFKGGFNFTTIDSIKMPSRVITRSVLLNSSSLVIRGLEKNLQKQVFQKVNTYNGVVTAEAQVIENQSYGGFDTDGMLLYDTTTHRLLYTEYYRNRFYCLDTNFKIIYTANTIDTMFTNTVEIKKVNLENESRLIPTKSRRTVNEIAFMSNNRLCIFSNFKADNETAIDFNKNIVIDTYRITDGKYSGSFYIPKTNKEKPKSILIFNEVNLAILYKNKISIFEIKL